MAFSWNVKSCGNPHGVKKHELFGRQKAQEARRSSAKVDGRAVSSIFSARSASNHPLLTNQILTQ